jgi:hypothetical protein
METSDSSIRRQIDFAPVLFLWKGLQIPRHTSEPAATEPRSASTFTGCCLAYGVKRGPVDNHLQFHSSGFTSSAESVGFFLGLEGFLAGFNSHPYPKACERDDAKRRMIWSHDNRETVNPSILLKGEQADPQEQWRGEPQQSHARRCCACILLTDPGLPASQGTAVLGRSQNKVYELQPRSNLAGRPMKLSAYSGPANILLMPRVNPTIARSVCLYLAIFHLSIRALHAH